jgi:hypothetical protein
MVTQTLTQIDRVNIYPITGINPERSGIKAKGKNGEIGSVVIALQNTIDEYGETQFSPSNPIMVFVNVLKNLDAPASALISILGGAGGRGKVYPSLIVAMKNIAVMYGDDIFNVHAKPVLVIYDICIGMGFTKEQCREVLGDYVSELEESESLLLNVGE